MPAKYRPHGLTKKLHNIGMGGGIILAQTEDQLNLPKPGALETLLQKHRGNSKYNSDAAKIYEMFTRDLGTGELPRIVAQTASIAGNFQSVDSQALEKALNDPALAPYVQKVRRLESKNPNGMVLVWLRQSHAETGFGTGGKVLSAIAEPSIENQKAIVAIGEALARKGVRFFGVENFAENLNNPLEFELPYADRKFTAIQNGGVPDELTNFITKGDRQSGIDFFPGALALQALYPALDIIGVDRFREPIIKNGLYLERIVGPSAPIVQELEAGAGQDPEAFYREVARLPGGKDALNTLRATYQNKYSYFSIHDDSSGRDSVGAALAVMGLHMAHQLEDPQFLEMARRSGGISANVMAVQYGAVHSGIIAKALEAGMDVLDVFPNGLRLEDFNRDHEHYQTVTSREATNYFASRIEMIERALENSGP